MDEQLKTEGGSFASHLRNFTQQMRELETAARKLKNENFADIVKLSANRFSQLSEHPDAERVGKVLKEEHTDGVKPEHEEGLRKDEQIIQFDPNAGT